MLRHWYSGQRIQFKALHGTRKYTATLIRPLKDGFWWVDDGTGRPPRAIHENRFGLIQIPKGEVFA
jgi:hypothetical protein